MIDGTAHCLSSGHFGKYLASKGLTVPEYVLQYESPAIRPTCKCGSVTGFHGNDGVNWTFLKVCGKPECAAGARADGLKAQSPEKKRAIALKAHATLNADPIRKAKAIENNKIANHKVGKDGLSGYERTAAKRAITLQEKYGHSAYANWDKTQKTIANWTDEQHQENVANRSAGQMAIPAEQKAISIAKADQTCISRNGKPAWKIAYDSSKGRRSNISEQFFNEVQNLIPETNLIFGAIEFSLIGENGTKYYDLVNSTTNKIVEFNGDYWHANPKKYLAEDQLRKASAQQIWDADAKKIALAEANGYQVKVVWESEYKKNPQKIIEECKSWLMN